MYSAETWTMRGRVEYIWLESSGRTRCAVKEQLRMWFEGDTKESKTVKVAMIWICEKRQRAEC